MAYARARHGRRPATAEKCGEVPAGKMTPKHGSCGMAPACKNKLEEQSVSRSVTNFPNAVECRSTVRAGLARTSRTRTSRSPSRMLPLHSHASAARIRHRGNRLLVRTAIRNAPERLPRHAHCTRDNARYPKLYGYLAASGSQRDCRRRNSRRLNCPVRRVGAEDDHRRRKPLPKNWPAEKSEDLTLLGLSIGRSTSSAGKEGAEIRRGSSRACRHSGGKRQRKRFLLASQS